ncbi:hypothetical protein [Rhizobium rhizogenes]|uniref:hypothetical protein n=1 Tax=Rhizobium rhizogenes TaxID=359 RepID=UPI0022CAC017|nr:hypothetical protein [Rhizobium rhizogenes]MCZ7482157.1 hypothetical protein [Rhizobium rhizogenes]
MAVIVEDDVAFTPEFSDRVKAMVAVMPENAVVKLTNHRRSGFKGRKTSARRYAWPLHLRSAGIIRLLHHLAGRGGAVSQNG